MAERDELVSKRTKEIQEERIMPPKSKSNCAYCKQPVLGKGYLVQKDFLRRNFCAISCSELFTEFERIMANQKRIYAWEDNSIDAL